MYIYEKKVIAAWILIGSQLRSTCRLLNHHEDIVSRQRHHHSGTVQISCCFLAVHFRGMLNKNVILPMARVESKPPKQTSNTPKGGWGAFVQSKITLHAYKASSLISLAASWSRPRAARPETTILVWTCMYLLQDPYAPPCGIISFYRKSFQSPWWFCICHRQVWGASIV